MELPDQLSPEVLEQMRDLLDRMGAHFPPADQTIGGLCNAHLELVDCLQEFDRESAVRLISALETIPHLHGNTVRLEVLLHVAVSRCKGSKHATPEELKQWIALMDASPMAPLEDPNEDVFIGYVCTSRGGYRVYQGILSNADFILERLIHFLARKTEFPGFGVACDSVIKLLRVSDAIADKLDQTRYIPGEIGDDDEIPVPPTEILETHTQAVLFDSARLSGLGIDPAKLDPFFLTPAQTQIIDSESLFGSTLEVHPLIRTDDGFIVASPSSLCRAAIVHILSTIPKHCGWADTFFEVESAEFFLNKILRALGVSRHDHFKLPSAPASLPPLYPVIGQFDYGMPVLALTKSSSLTEEPDLEAIESFTQEQVEHFTKYVADCCQVCESVEGFRGGLVLVGLSNVGRQIVIGLHDLRPHWHFFSSSLADWQTLASDKDFNAKRLWYLGIQQELAKEANLQIVNSAGLLNLYGFWKSNDFALVHEEVDIQNPNNMLALDGAYSLQVNRELKTINDRHCQRTHDASQWVILQRQSPGLDPNVTTNLMYVDHAAAGESLLRGCVTLKNCTWWVESDTRPSNPESRSLLFRLWECVFNWMEHTLPVMNAVHPPYRLERLKIELEFPGIDGWRVQDTSTPSGEPSNLGLTVDPCSSIARLAFSQGFLEKFYRPDNLAEREIVTAVIKAAAEISSITLIDTEVQQLTERVTKNHHTRFFHIVMSSSLESAIGGPENAEPIFVPFEEITRTRIGLAQKINPNPPNQITDSDEAQAFLNKAVAHLQQSLCSRLKQLHIHPVLSYSSSQLDELSRDGNRWSLSTRALIALNENADWLHERLRNETGRLALAEITNRVLIETAVYSNDPKAEEHISQTEHASLLAQLAVMIELANHRDAIAGGFVAADLKIHPNGMIDYDESFQRHVFQPYLTSRVDDRIRWHADSYDSYFEPRDQTVPPTQEESPALLAFKRAFHAEFGFAYETLDNVIDYFNEQAVNQRRGGGTLEARALRLVLKHKIGLQVRQVDSFLDRFVLPLRPGWDRNLPKGCDKSDVYPWRFFRGVSVLVRPFIEIGRSPRVFVISAPHLHRWKRYLSQSIFEGQLPDKLFRSTTMKSYLGSIANKKGHEFTKEVATSIHPVLPHQRVEIKLTELGAPQNPDIGDVDVLTWDSDTGIVFLIECKRLKTTLTVGQVVQQLEEFRGDAAEMDSLAKHKRRVEWIKANPKELSRITGLAENKIQWLPLLVTSGRVPMSFIDAIDFTKDQVVAAKDLVSRISSILSDHKAIQ